MTAATNATENLFANETWERTVEQGRFGVAGHGVIHRCSHLGGTLYEIAPGKVNMPYHAHHGMDELLVVIAGRPTLRTPEGERELAPGDLVEFPAGPAGAHQLRNDTDAPVRTLMLSSRPPVDVVEYPDSGKLGASTGDWGSPSWRRWLLDAAATKEYFDGELE